MRHLVALKRSVKHDDGTYGWGVGADVDAWVRIDHFVMTGLRTRQISRGGPKSGIKKENSLEMLCYLIVALHDLAQTGQRKAAGKERFEFIGFFEEPVAGEDWRSHRSRTLRFIE